MIRPIFLLLPVLSALILLPSFSSQASFSLFDPPKNTNPAQQAFLPVDQAFVLEFLQQGNKVEVQWKIADGYYLYRDRISVKGKTADTQIGAITLPEALEYHDEFFGDTFIYKHDVTINVPLLQATNDSVLLVGFQGCADDGFCYPPETIELPLSAVKASHLLDKNTSEPITDNSKVISQTAPTQSAHVTSLADNWWQPFLFLLLGIGLAFTPCVLPMYPILTGIILGSGKRSHTETFKLALIYVQGMALTYTLLGLLVASAGLQFQAALQHPYILIAVSLLFVALAGSMFGWYSFALPSAIQTRLIAFSNTQQGGSSKGVFVMGAISGLICSPCTTAPLSGALLYVAQSGDLLTGAVTLYALAIGMGIPLVIVALFGNKLLPKAGNWMEQIKIGFGFILLAAPLFFIERLISAEYATVLWLLWAVVLLGWLYHFTRTLPVNKWTSALNILVILALSITAIYGFQQLDSSKKFESASVKPNFIYVENKDQLLAELAKAKAMKKPVMLDFYADWCVACKEFEKYTFSDPSVAPELNGFVLLQADVTQNTKEQVELLNYLQVLGLPTLDFWNAKGEMVAQARLTGFVDADYFLTHLQQYQLLNKTLQ